jgi:hypothetical protein
VVHRFSEFDALAHVTSARDESLPPLPRKMPSLLLSGMEQQRRIVGLQKFSEAVLSNPHLLSLPAVSDFFDLNFGLWHAALLPPPRVDRAQQRAARMLQTEVRRWLSMLHLRRARGAASLIQCTCLPKEDGIGGDSGSCTADIAARRPLAAAAIFGQSAPEDKLGGDHAQRFQWSLSSYAPRLSAPFYT